jgi:hypothetical protein
MFTDLELSVIEAALANYEAVMGGQLLENRAKACRSALARLEILKDCTILLYCYGCEHDHTIDAFADHHVCRGCGKRLCDGYYEDNGPTCGAPKCDDWEKYERADYEYDRSKDR